MSASEVAESNDREGSICDIGHVLNAESTDRVLVQLCRKDRFRSKETSPSTESTVIGISAQDASLPPIGLNMKDKTFPIPTSAGARSTLHQANAAVGRAVRRLCSQATGNLSTQNHSWAKPVLEQEGDWTVTSESVHGEGFMGMLGSDGDANLTRPKEGDPRYVVLLLDVLYDPEGSRKVSTAGEIEGKSQSGGVNEQG
jgi:hypothetical protein